MKKRTKKSVALFAAILLLFSCFSVAVFAAESDFEWAEKDGKAVITKYVGTNKEVKVPDTLGGLPVAEIGEDVDDCIDDIQQDHRCQHGQRNLEEHL
mgnify:CR=1 FL=1